MSKMNYILVNQSTRTGYKFNSGDELLEAKSKVLNFAKNYESYSLKMEIDSEGIVLISDSGIEDLVEPIAIHRVASGLSSEDKDRELTRLSELLTVVPGDKIGYGFKIVDVSPALNAESNDLQS